MIYVSYHNLDVEYAFQLSSLLIRCYRNIWLDRYEIAPLEDWNAAISAARERATAALAIVSDDYLSSAYCRADFNYFNERGIPVIAVIPRDFSTDMIADFAFSDWVDFRRWFVDPNDLSVDNLLGQLPEAETETQTGERLDCLRQFIQDAELALANMPSAWAARRNCGASGACEIRPRLLHEHLLRDWDFTSEKAGNLLPVADVLGWSQAEPQFIISGEPGSGKSFFARLLALVQAHAAIKSEEDALPVWIDLAEWDERYASFDEFMESQWPLLSYWRHWLDNHQAFFILDNWSELCSASPAGAGEIAYWIDASPQHRFAVLSSGGPATQANLPRLRMNRLTAALAQKFAAGYLTLEQQNGFRQILRGSAALIEDCQLDFLAIGVELMAVDRALAFNQWLTEPMAALVSARLQGKPAASSGLTVDEILGALRQLAWSMMLQDNPRAIQRDIAEQHSSDSRIIPCAIEVGLLCAPGNSLRFESSALQSRLAVSNLKRDGLIKYLTRPEFASGQGRRARKWDGLTLIAVDSLAEEQRRRVIDQIADIDPFLAARCLRRHPKLYRSNAETLMAKLLDFCAQNPHAQAAFRAAIRHMPAPDRTAELMLGQLSRFNNAQQLWLWHEVRELPLDLPLDFLDIVRDLDRDAEVAVSDQIANYSLSLAVAWLVKLSRHEDAPLRQNAIWMLGEVKYLPTAILLLADLEDPQSRDQREVLLALMKFAYSEILARVLQWSQEEPEHRAALAEALAARQRSVTSRLIAFADARRLTLNPTFNEIAVHTDEADIAIGLAQIAAQFVDLPQAVETAVMRHARAGELQGRIASAIKHLPNRAGFEQLVEDIAAVLRAPPESTIIAGSKIEALLYGEPLFDEFATQAEGAPSSRLPPELTGQLGDADWRGRHRALNNLADYPAEATLPILLELSADVEKTVRLAAYELLSRFEGEAAAAKALFAALADPDEEVVGAASRLLQSMPGIDFEAVVDLLAAPNPTTAAAAIDILREGGHQSALPELRRLGADGRRPADGGQTIGQRARAAIAALETSAQEGVGSDSEPRPRDAATEPAFSDEEKISRTLQVLRDDDWGRTQKAAKFLRKFARHLRGGGNYKILRLLLDALADENWSVRWAAAEALAILESREAIPQLTARLADANWIVQVAAIRALAALGAAESAADITAALHSSQKTVREAAAEALGELSDTRAIPPLGEALKRDADEFVRYAAIKSIHQINASAARPWLELALSDGYAHIRLFAVKQLAPQMDETDLPILQQLLADDEVPAWEDESPRDLAIATLQRIDSAKCQAALAAAGIGDKRNGA